MKRQHLPTRLLTLLACTIAGLTAGAISVGASPGTQMTAGECTNVGLAVTTSTSSTTPRLSSPSGICKEFDRDSLDFIYDGPLSLFGDVASCTGAASHVEVSATLSPTGHNLYAPLLLSIDQIPLTNVAVVAFRTQNLPPSLVGSGVVLASPGNTCTSATWSDGVIAWEDPVVESP